MEQELNHKSVIIKGLLLKEGVSKGGKSWSKIEVHTDQDKYTIWIKKQDGTPTKAFTQLKTIGFPINKRTGIAYDVKDASFTNREGKEIDFKNRTIAFFEDSTQRENEQGQPERDVEAEQQEINEEISGSNEIDPTEIPF